MRKSLASGYHLGQGRRDPGWTSPVCPQVSGPALAHFFEDTTIVLAGSSLSRVFCPHRHQCDSVHPADGDEAQQMFPKGERSHVMKTPPSSHTRTWLGTSRHPWRRVPVWVLSPVLPVPLLPVAPQLRLRPVWEGERHSWTLVGGPNVDLSLVGQQMGRLGKSPMDWGRYCGFDLGHCFWAWQGVRSRQSGPFHTFLMNQEHLKETERKSGADERTGEALFEAMRGLWIVAPSVPWAPATPPPFSRLVLSSLPPGGRVFARIHMPLRAHSQCPLVTTHTIPRLSAGRQLWSQKGRVTWAKRWGQSGLCRWQRRVRWRQGKERAWGGLRDWSN